jgi:Cupin superfamily protein
MATFLPRLTLPPSFWDVFIRDYWRKKPGIFPGLCPVGVGTADECFAALQELARNKPPPERSPTVRVWADGVHVANYRSNLLPSGKDRSLNDYVLRASIELEGRSFGMMVEKIQLLQENIWSRANDFVHQLASRVQLPWGNVMVDAFLGNYRQTFFRLHKDEQDVFTFVVAGVKRYLLWPFEAFAHIEGVRPDGELLKFYPSPPAAFDHLRDRACVLEGRPGDLLYWPATQWHIAESDGNTHLTVGIGLLFANNAPSLLAEAFRRVLRGNPPQANLPLFWDYPADGPFNGSLASVRDPISHVMASPAFARTLEEVLVAWTGRGAGLPPPPSRLALAPEDQVARARPPAIGYLKRDEDVLVAANGETLSLPLAPQTASLLEALNAGCTLRVGELSTDTRQMVEALHRCRLVHVLGSAPL